jgi:hypothetical protein
VSCTCGLNEENEEYCRNLGWEISWKTVVCVTVKEMGRLKGYLNGMCKELVCIVCDCWISY